MLEGDQLGIGVHWFYIILFTVGEICNTEQGCQ